MRSGSLRHRLTIKTLVRTPDGYGGFVREDATASPVVNCSVRPANPREISQYGQLQQNVTHQISLRWRSDITHGMTVTVEGVDHYVVSAINPDTVFRELVLMTRTGGAL